MAEKTAAIFLDRDGVINENRSDHVKSWEEFQFIPGAIEAIAELTKTGLPIFVVTNQGIISKGGLTVEALNDIHARMLEQIEAGGGSVKKVFYCPHHDHDKCDCRKPAPGMLIQAAEEFGIDTQQSYMVGDAWTDIGAGLAVGARSILLMTGRGRWNLASCWNHFDVRFSAAVDLADAVNLIKDSLAGKPMVATFRLMESFHMALRPELPVMT
ncbi:MAG TPA: D-glycero-beta-D-manno-heptose 1,7-bisphosphate 7-phosphatase [Aggregatilineales bacterium]|nr:D-glycero-beta-D-manno-heptose 1,7-bisphosphate 7-phosphatase [Anaerolineae bacterium]HUN06001.1 D-glycero-beta-D-manno-heptose 1,7-bisphosphate 7-phosphatase [Aggregatilineales bacterium]